MSDSKLDGAEQGKPGRPTLYSKKVVDRLISAMEAGMFFKDACARAGISVSTLADWRERHPELETLMAEAREKARQSALERIRDASANDWRAAEAWLRLSFPEYRQSAKVEVNATTNVATAGVVVTDAKRQELIERHKRLLEEIYREKESGG